MILVTDGLSRDPSFQRAKGPLEDWLESDRCCMLDRTELRVLARQLPAQSDTPQQAVHDKPVLRVG